jgi:hypothetical protein
MKLMVRIFSSPLFHSAMNFSKAKNALSEMRAFSEDGSIHSFV